jgi:predicted phosphoribosyltransferase
MMFRDRAEAGQRLAAALQRFAADHPLILGLPRGGVVVGAEVAQALRCDWDVLLVKKLRAPGDPELALGAICEQGRAFINEEVRGLIPAPQEYMDHEIQERLAEIAEQRRVYREVKTYISPTNRVAILIDDGLATGATMIAAVQATALLKPRRLIVAVPVGPPDTLGKPEGMPQVDEVVCLDTPSWFQGVGQFYEDFRQVSDEEVVRILESAH